MPPSQSPQPLRILWLKSGPLHPLDTGGKIRTFNTLRELQKRHSIEFLALWADGSDLAVEAKASEYSANQAWVPWRETPKQFPNLHCAVLRNLFFSRLPYVLDKYRFGPMADALQKAAQPERCDLVVCDFLTPAVNMPPAFALKVPTILFQHNVESLIWKRTAENAVGFARRTYFRNQWHRIRTFEGKVCAAFDGVITVSEDDASILRGEFGLTNVLGSVPTGVDTEHFQDTNAERKPFSLVFLGSMDWMPNIDAVLWFAESIFPQIKTDFPDVTLTVVGRNPTSAVRDLAARDPRVRVTGTVADVRPDLAQAQVMIVPLRVGGGTRIKIFEAMATGIPVVSTWVGAEGLPVTDQEEILLADTPDCFAAAVTRLFRSEPLRRQIGHAGLGLVREKFSWAASVDVFESYCKKVVSTFALSHNSGG